MISREEYNKALDIVEAYHKQLFLCGVGSSLMAEKKTRLFDWDKRKLLPVLLQNVFKNVSSNEDEKGGKIHYIEDLTWQEFKKFRLAGKKGWEDFIKVRGY
jgi:hypothetical protein